LKLNDDDDDDKVAYILSIGTQINDLG